MEPPEGRRYFALEGGFNLGFDLEAVKQWNAVFVELDLMLVLRHHLLMKVTASS